MWDELSFCVVGPTRHLIRSSYEPQKVIDAETDCQLRTDLDLDEQ